MNITVRNFSHDDIESIYRIFSDEKVNQYLPWFCLKNMEDAERFYEEKLSGKYNFAICLEDDRPIGYINVSQDKAHDLGYGLLSEYWSKGIISSACLKVIDIVKKEGLRYVTATHDVNNVASGKVMQKIGMKYQYSYIEFWEPKNFEVTFRMYQLNFEDDIKPYDKYWKKYDRHFVEEV